MNVEHPHVIFRRWASLSELAELYDRDGGGGDQFRSHIAHTPHTRSHYRLTAAYEALRIDRLVHPWRHPAGGVK